MPPPPLPTRFGLHFQKAAKATLLVLLVLIVSGCSHAPTPRQENPPIVEVPAEPLSYVGIYSNVTAVRHTGRGVADAVAYGLVLGHANCVFFVPQKPETSFHILNGTIAIHWDDSSIQNYVVQVAEQGAIDQRSPPSPSPLVASIPELVVDYASPFTIMPRVQEPSTSFLTPVTITVSFTYEGDAAVRPLEGNCSFEDPQ